MRPAQAGTVVGVASPGSALTVGQDPTVDRISVLIADDEPALRGALAELLGQEDQVRIVGTAGDADEAIELAHSSTPDIALVDVKMPAGGGPRAAREIIRVSPATRVIALSAFEDRPTVLEMLRAGAVGYLVKGTAAEQIVDSIAKVMQGGTSLSSEVVGGLVAELTSQLRRQEIVEEELEQRRTEIHRFLSGEGLTMAFQPILDLRTGTIVGTEALARFGSLPQRSPIEWFAEAVQLELGVQLELATIREAMRALSKLPQDVYLSLNASPRAAMSPALPGALGDLAGRIVIEITEHEAIADYTELMQALAALRGVGVKIAIDDAGAGFASLRHTLQIAPDIVKVDMSLVRDIDKDRGRRALASALISFSDEMEMEIIAEGIETKEELDTLLELGVRYGQGFFLAKPGPI
jgi:EAL domain-containing protein (putative c-di-GMP-specific phosphodiesterase class I)/ActR/RegA family two-component response regulator